MDNAERPDRAPPSSSSPADTGTRPDDTDNNRDDRSFIDHVADTLSAPPIDAEGNARSNSPVADRINNTKNFSIDDIKGVFSAGEPPVTPEQSHALEEGAAVMEGVATVPPRTPETPALDQIAAEKGLDLFGRPPTFDEANQVQMAGDFMPNITDIKHLAKFEVRGPGGSVTAASGRDQYGNLITDSSLKVGRGPVSGTINTNGEGSIGAGAGPVSGQLKTDDSAGVGASIPGYSKHVETDGTVVETYGGTANLPGSNFTAERTDRTSPEGEVTRTYTGGAGLGTKERGISAEISVVDRDNEAPPAKIDDPAQESEVRDRAYIDRPPDDLLNGEGHEKEVEALDARLEKDRLEREAQRELVRELGNTP